jgi:hypothetical protein
MFIQRKESFLLINLSQSGRGAKYSLEKYSEETSVIFMSFSNHSKEINSLVTSNLSVNPSQTILYNHRYSFSKRILTFLAKSWV